MVTDSYSSLEIWMSGAQFYSCTLFYIILYVIVASLTLVVFPLVFICLTESRIRPHYNAIVLDGV